MAERGIDIGEQRPKGLQEFLGTALFDFVITVCDRAEKECPMFPGRGARGFWPLEDPGRAEGSDEKRLASSTRCATTSKRASGGSLSSAATSTWWS